MVDPAMTERWARITPDHFKFTAKMHQEITHSRRLCEHAEVPLRLFYESMVPLKDKLGCVLVQLPPSLTKDEGFKKLKMLALDPRFRHAIEVRHTSWFVDEFYEFLRENDYCLTWSHLAKTQTPPVLTTDFVCLRFIGDRSIPETKFGTLQKERSGGMQYWVDEIKKVDKSNLFKSGRSKQSLCRIRTCNCQRI